jgi:uncharacterized repeat protein (TIGR02543 family)
VSHAVTFNWNDGTAAPTQTVSVSKNTSTPLPKVDASNNRAKTGYTHTGWTAAGDQTVLSPESNYLVTALVTLTAVWTPVPYDIHY